MGEARKVSKERGVHPLNLTVFGTNTMCSLLEEQICEALAQAATTSKGVFQSVFNVRVCLYTCDWVQLCLQAVIEEAARQIDPLSAPLEPD